MANPKPVIGSQVLPKATESAPTSFHLPGQELKPYNKNLIVDNIRFLSMVAIIIIHTVTLFQNKQAYTTNTIPVGFLQLFFKFASIAFFLISGFLLGERLEHSASFEYFARRLRRLFVPWSFWFILLGLEELTVDSAHRLQDGITVQSVADTYCSLLSSTAFWFVPNLLLSLGLILLLRRFLDDPRLGAILLAASLFYSANIYLHWMPVPHTKASFGFVFYLWLGAWSSRHWPAINGWLERIPATALAVLVPLSLLLSFAESKRLLAIGSIDPLNTLRASNQIYALLVVLLLVKIGRPVWPRWMNVRQHTFGLYLTHTMILFLFFGLINHIAPAATSSLSAPITLLAIAMTFLVTYATSWTLVRCLAASPHLHWMIGAQAEKMHPTVSPKYSPRPAQTLTGRSVVCTQL